MSQRHRASNNNDPATSQFHGARRHPSHPHRGYVNPFHALIVDEEDPDNLDDDDNDDDNNYNTQGHPRDPGHAQSTSFQRMSNPAAVHMHHTASPFEDIPLDTLEPGDSRPSPARAADRSAPGGSATPHPASSSSSSTDPPPQGRRRRLRRALRNPASAGLFKAVRGPHRRSKQKLHSDADIAAAAMAAASATTTPREGSPVFLKRIRSKPWFTFWKFGWMCDSTEDKDANVEYTEIPSDSRYPEVRASVPNTDDFDMPQNTLRMWIIGFIMTTLGCIINTVFFLHSPSFAISTFVASMVAWPLGRLWERFMPDRTVLGVPLNPAPFNLKEHALITIMAGVSFGEGAAYMTDIVLALRHFYGIDFGWGFSIIGVICTQAIGYSLAGIVRRILVYPASMIWPNTLVTTTFLTNIHLNINHVVNGWHISRLRLFLFVMIACFAWSWIPGFLCPFLSDFGVLTWLTPNNVVINQLFGTRSGLGLLPITFDWNQITGYIGSPLIPPFFAIGNIMASVVLVFWIVCPIIHYSNVWYGRYLPMSSNDTYDRYQNVYNVSRILTPDNVFDLKKYEAYSPMFLPAVFAVSYGMSFASFSSTITHTLLFHSKEIFFFWRNSRKEPDDIHMHLMKRYREAPDWWYFLCLLVFLTMSIVLVRVWDTDMPVWVLFLALAIAFVMLIPIGMIYALTNISVGLNVITEFIVGFIVPGRPIAMMLFKTFGYITNYQAILFLEGIKLGHYMKISPRLMFFAQLSATIWGGVVQLAVLSWAEANIQNVCEPQQAAGFTCSAARVFFNASVIWGVVGPQRFLAHGALYAKTLFFFLVGGMLPIASWLFLKRYPKSPVRHIHWPVFFTGTGYIPPATAYNYGAYCFVGYIFGYSIKRKYFGWWAKYNYTLSAGLDLGLAWASLIIFIITLVPRINRPEWWGLNITKNNADYRASPMVQLAPGEAFGPSTW